MVPHSNGARRRHPGGRRRFSRVGAERQRDPEQSDRQPIARTVAGWPCCCSLRVTSGRNSASVVYAGGTINAQGTALRQLHIGSGQAVGSSRRQLDVAPFLIGDYTYVRCGSFRNRSRAT